MTTLGQFVTTVYLLVVDGKWAELQEYFALTREVINNPTARVIVQSPTDKPV